MDETTILRKALEEIAGEPNIRRGEHANSFAWADLAARNCLIARTALARASSAQEERDLPWTLFTKCGVIAIEGLGCAQLSDQQGSVIDIADEDDAAMIGAWLIDWARRAEKEPSSAGERNEC